MCTCSELSSLTVSILASTLRVVIREAALVHVVSSIITILAIASSTLKPICGGQALDLISGLPHALVSFLSAVESLLSLVFLLLQVVVVGPNRVVLELLL